MTKLKLTTKLVRKSKLWIENNLTRLEEKVLTKILNLMLLFYIDRIE
jgi:hypothetical protein